MAITIQKSQEVTLAAGKLSDNTAGKYRYWPAEGAKMRYAHFTLPATTVLGDDGSSVDLVNLPHGQVRILPNLCRAKVSAFGASRVMNLGMRAYVASDGKTAVAANLTDFVSGRDVSGATDTNFGLTDVKKDYFSATGLTVCATVTGGTIPVGATMEGYVAYEIVQ